ncbi:unnamed protein product [Rotaria sp. Silwood2]|nr:unnamed protein product [Rotaria sp. Silwood2]
MGNDDEEHKDKYASDIILIGNRIEFVMVQFVHLEHVPEPQLIWSLRIGVQDLNNPTYQVRIIDQDGTSQHTAIDTAIEQMKEEMKIMGWEEVSMAEKEQHVMHSFFSCLSFFLLYETLKTNVSYRHSSGGGCEPCCSSSSASSFSSSRSCRLRSQSSSSSSRSSRSDSTSSENETSLSSITKTKSGLI